MQNAGNVELARHIAGELGERRPVYRLEVDWDGNDSWTDLTPVVKSLSVERSLTGDLPEDAGLIDGPTSSALEATLEGHWVNPQDGQEWPITTALSRFVPGSLRDGRQLVKAKLRASMGFVLDAGPLLMRQFTGPLRILSGNEDDGTVKLSGVDPSDRLRAPITLPTYAEFITHAARRAWALTVNTQWLLHHVLAENGIHASPPPRAESIIVASGHGGLVANRGFNGAPISIYGTGPQAGLWTEDGHPYGMLGTPENATGGTVGYQEFYGVTDGVTIPLKFQAGYGAGLSCLLHMGSYMALGALENRLFQIKPTATKGPWAASSDGPRLFVNGFGNGDIYAGLVTGGGAVYGTPRIATGASRWRFFGVHFQFTSDTTLVVRVRMDGQLRTYTLTTPSFVGVESTTPTPFYEGYRPILQVNANLFRAWSNLQVWPTATPPAAGVWQGETHVPQASVARGQNELVYLPDVAGADSWELMKAGASAEFGVHGFDEDGFYSFRPRTDVRPSAVDLDLDVTTNLSDAKWSVSTDSVRNIVSVTTKSAHHAGVLESVVKADDALQFVCPVGTTIFSMDWPHGAAGYQGGVLPYHYQEKADTAARDKANGFPLWGSDVVHGWTFSSKGSSGNWTILDNDRSVVVRYFQIGAREVQVRVSNPGPGPIRLATAQPADGTSAGDPALRIGGWPLVQATDHVEEVRAPQARIDAHLGERVLPLSTSDWRQRPEVYRGLAGQLLDALSEEVEVLEDLAIVGDPRVQEGDVVRLHFPAPARPVIGTVVKAVPAADDDGIVGSVSVRPLPEAGVALALAPAGVLFYVDVSHYQGESSPPLDLAQLRSLGYAGCVVKIGQGAGTYTRSSDGKVITFGQTLDDYWPTFRDRSLALWPRTTMGYWYVGNVETPASQAQRCADAIGDTSIPVMLDWENASGSWSNLLACRDAFRAAGLKVTTVYTSSGYASANGAANIDAAGLGLIRARYWVDDPAGGDPRALWDAQPAGFGFGAFSGGTPRAQQFTQYGVVYPGQKVDVNAFQGTADQLAALFQGTA